MPRKPIGNAPMTTAQRVQRHRRTQAAYIARLEAALRCIAADMQCDNCDACRECATVARDALAQVWCVDCAPLDIQALCEAEVGKRVDDE